MVGTLISFYIAVGLGWSVGAGFDQLKISSSKLKLIMNVVLNLFGWPVAMYLAYNLNKDKFAQLQ